MLDQFLALLSNDAALPALVISLLTAAGLIPLGTACMTVLIPSGNTSAAKVFPHKLSKQMAEFGLIVLSITIVLVLARWGLWVADIWEASPAWRRFYNLYFDIPGQLVLLSILVSAQYLNAWKKHKKASTRHFVLGGLGCLVWLVALMLFVLGWLDTAALSAQDPLPKMNLLELPARLLHPLPWLLWAQGLFLGLALAAGFGQLYLVLRRNAEDFGRDYYAWAARACAGRALGCGIIQAAWSLLLYILLTIPWPELALLAPSQWPGQAVLILPFAPALPAMLLFMGLSLLAWLTLLPLIASQTPMRLKGLMLAHAVLLLASLPFLVQAYAVLLT